MENSVELWSNVRMPQFRSFDEFICDKARFQVPDVNNMEKWGRRVYFNLLYYQTNYIHLSLMHFFFICLFYPLAMICGFTAIAVAFALFYFTTTNQAGAMEFRKRHPFVGIFFLIGGAFFCHYMLGCVVVCVFGIFLPISMVFIHASTRLRNLKNKLTNRIDIMTHRRTPMGILLEMLGIDPEMN